MKRLFWLRNDLRLQDNPGLQAARQGLSADKDQLLLVVVRPSLAMPSLGAAKAWWYGRSLAALDEQIRGFGGHLLFWDGPLDDLIKQELPDEVHWNRRYEPQGLAYDKALKASLKGQGIKAVSHKAALINEPWTVRNKLGGIFKVFTPFKRYCRTLEPMDWPITPSLNNLNPCLSPGAIQGALDLDQALKVWRLYEGQASQGQLDWAVGFARDWQPGEGGAAHKLQCFIKQGLETYAEDRNRPDREGVSRLSPHLAFGEVSPQQVMQALKGQAAPAKDMDSFIGELYWREYAAYLLFHYPEIETRAWKPAFDHFPWRSLDEAETQADLKTWQRGQTGYPMVDAGMRQLWQTGWMHNRVRMIVASYLIKHLRIDWREGERWFWDTLVDADKASNVAGWQWVAGSGADASPYFRIFNPIGQGQKFDPTGAYVRRFVPELAKLPAKLIHAPWTASPLELQAADVRLGQTYPNPQVDHKQAREQALAAYAAIKSRV